MIFIKFPLSISFLRPWYQATVWECRNPDSLPAEAISGVFDRLDKGWDREIGVIGMVGQIGFNFLFSALGAQHPVGNAFVIERSLFAQSLPIFLVAGAENAVTIGRAEFFTAHMEACKEIVRKRNGEKKTQRKCDHILKKESKRRRHDRGKEDTQKPCESSTARMDGTIFLERSHLNPLRITRFLIQCAALGTSGDRHTDGIVNVAVNRGLVCKTTVSASLCNVGHRKILLVKSNFSQ